MSYERLGENALEYYPCRYGGAKTLFRGPKKKLDRDFVAFVGGSEFYGRFIEHPLPDLVEDATGHRTVNFAMMNAGVDAYLQEPRALNVIRDAKLTFVQLFPAHALSNRFYRVHPRRNDRFVGPSELLNTLYPELDFSDFHFVRHLMLGLYRTSREKFRIVVDELQTSWTARMRLLMAKLPAHKILVHVNDSSDRVHDPELGQEPLFVTEEMIADIAKAAKGVVRYDPAETRAKAGTNGMIFDQVEAQIAEALLPTACHEEMAKLLSPHVNKHL